MAIIRSTFLAAVLAVSAVAGANAASSDAAPTRGPKASYAQLSRSTEAPSTRVATRHRAPAGTVPARPCADITCPGFILLGVGY